MLANPLTKYAVMNPIFAPSTHPIQPNTVETTSASRFFNQRPPFRWMPPAHRRLPRKAYGADSIPLTIRCASLSGDAHHFSSGGFIVRKSR